MRFTKRNHHNPCMWTALWNVPYFEAVASSRKPTAPAREQVVFVLNVRSSKIYETAVERVHFDQDLGLAEVTTDSMKAFCRRWHPDKYDVMAAYVEEHPESLYLNFEDILQATAQIARYESLIEAARLGGISSPAHRAFLTCLLIIHAMRSYEMMRAMVDAVDSIGITKWEYFWGLKSAWSDPLILIHFASVGMLS
jgi:hypothetical protein